MAVVTEAFDIPMDIMTKLATGEYRRLGGVVRVAIGPNKRQIVKHLDPIKIEQVAQNKNVVTKVIEFSKKNRKVIIIGTAVVEFVESAIENYTQLCKTILEKKTNKEEYEQAVHAHQYVLETFANQLEQEENLTEEERREISEK